MPVNNMIIYFFTFALFFFISWKSKHAGTQRLFNEAGTITPIPEKVINAHLAGICTLGVIPLLLLKNAASQVLTGYSMPESYYLLLYLLLLTLVISIAFKQSKITIAKKDDFTGNFKGQSSAVYTHYFIIRCLFLFVYELWFRGLFLFNSIDLMGIPAAILLNVFLYAAVHMFNSKIELLASIPFGILLCLLSILFNTVWPAAIFHIAFSLVYEINMYRSYYHTAKTIRQ